MSRKTTPTANRSRSKSHARARSLPIRTDFDRSELLALLATMSRDDRKELRDSLNLSGVMLAGSDLSGMDLSYLNLNHAGLAGCDLTNTDFEGSHCFKANFSGATLVDTDFTRARITGANFAKSRIKKAIFDCADVSESDFSGANIEAPYLIGASLFLANFSNAVLRRTDFMRAELGRNNWSGSRRIKCSFVGAKAAGQQDPRIRPHDLPAGANWEPLEESEETAAAAPPAPGADASPEKPAAPQAIAAQPARPGKVWKAYADTASTWSGLVGFLVTDAEDRNILIAFVRTREDPAPAAQLAANRIADDFFEVLDEPEACDLRAYCRLNSAAPTPAEFYDMRLRELGGKDPGDGIVCTPFCRFRMAKLVATHNRLWLTRQERRAHPFDQIGAGDAPAERGVNSAVTRSVAIVTAEMPL